jgi:hypothetical protein
MAPLNKQNRRRLQRLKKQYDLGPGYAEIIRDAVINDFSEQQIIRAITRSDTFKRQFPGIFESKGTLQSFLTGTAETNLNASTLSTAIKNYRSLQASYEDVAGNFGGVVGKIGRDKVAALIRSETSPEEFAAKARAIQLATENAGAIDIFNQQLKAQGLPPLKGQDVFKFIAKAADQKFYDVYEAARIRQLAPGLDLSTADAAKIAKSLQNVDDQGQQTGAGDIGGLLTRLSADISDIGSDLKGAGIDNLRLAKYLANPGADPELAAKIEQVRATKRARGQYVAGTQPKQGPGGVKLDNDGKAAAYG